MSESKEVENLFKNIQSGLKTYSVKDLNKAIVSFLSKKHEKITEIDFIMIETSKKFEISVEKLNQANTRGIIQDAKQVCYCLLHFDLGLSIRNVAKIFGNYPNSVATGVNRLKNCDSNIKYDKIFLENYKEMQVRLNKFITEK